MEQSIELSWLAPNIDDTSGYGHISRQLARAIKKEGITLLPSGSFDWDAMVIVAPPSAMLLGRTPRPDVVYHTMFEAEPVPATWVKILNRVGLVWVPSQFCKTLFESSGVKTPIVVSGYGIDTEVFTPCNRHGRTGPFTVLVWGDSLVSRKHLLNAIRVFLHADIPDSRLEVKINDPLAAKQLFALDEFGTVRPNITVLSQPLSRQQLADWVHRGDVGLYLSGGEGWGRIPPEMMVTDLPVVCAYNTGMLDYLTPTNCLPVACPRRVSVPSLTVGYGMELTVCEPDWEEAIAKLRWCAANREAAYTIGEQGGRDIRPLTWARAGKGAASLLSDFLRHTHGRALG